MHQLVTKEGSVLLMHGVTMKFSDQYVANFFPVVKLFLYVPPHQVIEKMRAENSEQNVATFCPIVKLVLYVPPRQVIEEM